MKYELVYDTYVSFQTNSMSLDMMSLLWVRNHLAPETHQPVRRFKARSPLDLSPPPSPGRAIASPVSVSRLTGPGSCPGSQTGRAAGRSIPATILALA
jgi:hypothetical protein